MVIPGEILFTNTQQDLNKAVNRDTELQEAIVFLVVLPIFNALMMSTVNFFKESIPVGEIRAAILLLFFIYFLIRRFPKSYANRTNLILIIYILFSGLYTFLEFGVFNVVAMRIILATFFFSAGYYYVNSYERFILMNKAFFISLFIILLIIGLSNILNLEVRQVYTDVDINFGAQGVNTTKILTLFILLYPVQEVVLRGTRMHKYLLPVIAVSLVLVFMGLKRGAVFGLLAGSSVLLITGAFQGRTMKRVLYIILLLAITTPVYYPRVVKMYEARENQIKFYEDDQYRTEARFSEVERTFEDIKNKDFLSVMIGEGLGSEMYYFGTNRMIHTDYISILHGGGIIGLIIYLFSYLAIMIEQKRYHRILKRLKIFSLLWKVSLALLACASLLALSGLYHTIDLRAVLLMFLGGSAGLSRSYLKSISELSD